VISLISDDKTAFQHEFVWSSDRLKPVLNKSFDINSAPLGYILESKTSILLSSQTEQDLKSRFQTVRTAIEAGVASLMVTPLISASGGVIGALHVASANRDMYTTEDI
jgi:hypothetical protein